jgi:aminoglycoside phosphotransferase (APT) family kinase protein
MRLWSRTVKQRLAAHTAPAVIGHGDFYSQNIHWRNGELLAVHDGDSVVVQPEAAIAG